MVMQRAVSKKAFTAVLSTAEIESRGTKINSQLGRQVGAGLFVLLVLAQLYSHAGTSSRWSLGFHAGKQAADTDSTSWYFSAKSTTPRALRPGQDASLDSAGSPAQRSIGREEPLEHLVSASILHSQRPFVGLAGTSKDHPVESPDEFPKDFDAEAYFAYYPEILRGADDDVNEAELAHKHYREQGYKEQRVYKRLRVLLRYTTCGSLFEQHFSHIAGLTIAATLGADVVVPPYLVRDKIEAPQQPQQWHAEPFSNVWDVEHIQKFFEAHGRAVAPAPVDPHEPWHIEQSPDEEFQWHTVDAGGHQVHVQISKVHKAAAPLASMLDTIKAEALKAASAASGLEGHFARSFPVVIVDLPCTLFAIRTSLQHAASALAANLRFAPRLEALVDVVSERIWFDGGGPAAGVSREDGVFNALDLRFGGDGDVQLAADAKLHHLQEYLQGAAAVGFSPTWPMYIASVPAHQADHAWTNITSSFGPYAQKLLHKELFLSELDMQGLGPAQLELLDLLVMVQARSYVGSGSSLASRFVREYRHVLKMADRGTSRLVGQAGEEAGLLGACATLL